MRMGSGVLTACTTIFFAGVIVGVFIGIYYVQE
jgi:hypothetical protein